MSKSASYVHDFSGWTDNLDEMKNWCKHHGKKWVFQQIRGDGGDGDLHYQGRISLKGKVRPATLKRRSPDWLKVFPTSTTDNDFYVTNEETRVAGPWSDRDTEIPIDVRAMNHNLRPWQMDVYDIVTGPWSPSIHIVVDSTIGGIGKTLICRYLAVYNHAKMIPPINNYDTIMQMVYDMDTIGAYTMDIPRSMENVILLDMYEALEKVKEGTAYTRRYRYKTKLFDPPNIVVFTTEAPHIKWLTPDKFKLWKVVDHHLVNYSDPDPIDGE